jgi:hypothetical protein
MVVWMLFSTVSLLDLFVVGAVTRHGDCHGGSDTWLVCCPP